MKRILTVAMLVTSLLFSQTALAVTTQKGEKSAPRSFTNGHVEPGAGDWRTWVISSGRDFRVQPPPSPNETQAELRSVAGVFIELAQEDGSQ